MPAGSPLKVLSIAHGAVRADLGRIRYRDFAGRDDISVDLVGPDRWREYGRTMEAEPASPDDVRLHIKPIRLGYVPGINWYAHHYPQMSGFISRVDPDVVHLWEEPWSLVALQAARLRGRSALVLEVDQNILKKLPPPFEQIRRYVLRQTDVILARSREAEEVVRACGFNGPVLPIGYGVDQGLFHPTVPARQRQAGELLRTGYVGRLCEEKGLDDALDAIAAAKCAVHLAIMGEGPYEARLRQRIDRLGISHRVSIVGWQGLDAVAEFLRGLDVSVLLSRATPSWKEQFGRTIIESQSSGVPVIGSNSGSIAEVVGAGGWIVAERDAAGVARVIERISAAPGELAAKRVAGLENVEQRFTYAIAAKQLEAAWREADQRRNSKKVVGAAAQRQSNAEAVTAHCQPDFKIVQVVRDMIEGGGVEMVAVELARAWQCAGIDCLSIARNCTKHRNVCIHTERVARFLSKMPTRGAYRYVGRAIVVPAFTVAATWALRRHRDAVVLSHGDSLAGDVLVVHAVNAASIDAKRRAGSRKWMLNPMHMWAAGRDRYMVGGLRYRHFVAVSLRAGQELRDYYGVPDERITVIPNGIDLLRFKPDPVARDRIRDEFRISDDAQVLLFVGHEFDRKGLAHAVAALEKLPDNVRLLVVGSDSKVPYQRLLKGNPDRLIFAGERLDMPAFFAAADAFVLPSQYETFALVGMEAMACGVPVFATRVGGIEDYLRDGVNGMFIEANGTDIAAKVGPLLQHPDQLSKLSAGARETAREYAWPVIASRYAELLYRVWREKQNGARRPRRTSVGAKVASHLRLMPGE